MGWLIWLYQLFCFFFLLYSQVSYSSPVLSSSNSTFQKLCPQEESLALLQFKQSFTIKSSAYSISKMMAWKEATDCCVWDEVTCDGATGHVVGLDLGGYNLHGTINSNSSLFQLHHLKRLNLAYNYFNSSQMPSEFGWFTKLTHLNLTHSDFSGSIPPSLGNLTQITDLDFSYNNFNGQFPFSVANFSFLVSLRLSYNELTGPIASHRSGLPDLVYLDLSGNSLNGQIPHWLFTLPSLQYLNLRENDLFGPITNHASGLQNLTYIDLSGNSLNGTIPSWLFILPSLEFVILGDNELVGPIPNDTSELQNLTRLYLYQNSFNGTLPSWLFTLPSLIVLYLSNNKFTGHIHEFHQYNSLETVVFARNELQGSIPKSIFKLVNLTYLDLSSNNLSGIVELHMFSKLQKLGTLELSNNSLSCSIENNCTLSKIRTLSFINLRSNLFQGPLPVPPPNIQYFSISDNSFTGEVPSLICHASSLQILDLSKNNLSGVIPQCLGNFSSPLSVLDLRMNRFHGPIPTTFTNGNLRSLNLNGNQLEGPVPQSLVNCVSLEVLDLGNNNINDTFPNWLETLSDLQALVLRSNKFHGPIGSTSKTKNPFRMLRIIDLSHNEFTGVLPRRYLENLSAMMHVDDEKKGLEYMGDSFYQDTVTETIEGHDIELVRILTIFTSIDLSDNKLQGEIPSVIGKLASLRLLNISHNNPTGYVPSALGSLTSLESLDLSSNQLLGEIPWQLTNLVCLGVLNFSKNHLEGPIPRGQQFDTFQSDSYDGNLALCGLPLPNKCGNDDAPHQAPPPIFAGRFSWGVTLMGYGCGMVFGLFMGYIMFSTGKPEWFVRIIEEKCCQMVKRMEKADRRRVGRGNRRFIRS